MNREILFKAKRIDNGEWVEGYYCRHETRMLCVAGDSLKEDEVKHYILQDSFADWNMPRSIDCIEIDPETLCQYTGLTDKNGKKIFDGDTITYLDGGIDESGDAEEFLNKGDVTWEADYLRYYPTNRASVDVDDVWECIDEVEVIGNIHDKE